MFGQRLGFDPRSDPRAETDATVTLDAKTGKVTGAAKVAGATDKAFTAPTDAVSTGDTYFCVVEFYNSKLDRETAYAWLTAPWLLPSCGLSRRLIAVSPMLP